jgi:hypothetical protein
MRRSTGSTRRRRRLGDAPRFDLVGARLRDTVAMRRPSVTDLKGRQSTLDARQYA